DRVRAEPYRRLAGLARWRDRWNVDRELLHCIGEKRWLIRSRLALCRRLCRRPLTLILSEALLAHWSDCPVTRRGTAHRCCALDHVGQDRNVRIGRAITAHERVGLLEQFARGGHQASARLCVRSS